MEMSHIAFDAGRRYTFFRRRADGKLACAVPVDDHHCVTYDLHHNLALGSKVAMVQGEAAALGEEEATEVEFTVAVVDKETGMVVLHASTPISSPWVCREVILELRACEYVMAGASGLDGCLLPRLGVLQGPTLAGEHVMRGSTATELGDIGSGAFSTEEQPMLLGMNYWVLLHPLEYGAAAFLPGYYLLEQTACCSICTSAAV